MIDFGPNLHVEHDKKYGEKQLSSMNENDVGVLLGRLALVLGDDAEVGRDHQAAVGVRAHQGPAQIPEIGVISFPEC